MHNRFPKRQPRDSWVALSEDDCQVKLRLGIRSVKAQERNLEPVDTRLEILAEAALEDTCYQRMLHHTENNIPLEEIEQDSELFLMGSERQYLSTFS